MSGINGFYNLDGRPPDPLLLRQMTEAIAHRGPDGIRHWIDGPVAFGHLMLQTIPESVHEKQPLTNADTTPAGMEGILPEMVRSRTLLAHPGGAFLQSLLSQHSELSGPAQFKQSLGPVQRYVNLNAVEADRKGVAVGLPDAGDSVWKALNLALWLESRNLQIG